MHRSKFLLIAISSALLLTSNPPALIAKENSKPTAKEKVKENKQATPKNGSPAAPSVAQSEKPVVSPKENSKTESTPTRPKNESSVAKVDPVKPAQSETVKVEKSENPTKAETSQKPEVVGKKIANKVAESVEDFTSTPSNECKLAANAKKKVAQNLCYDFIVVFKSNVARGNSDKLLKDSGARKFREFSKVFNGALVNGPLAKMQALAKNQNVLVIEDDLDVKTTALQSPAPWGLDRIDQVTLPLNQSFDDRDESGTATYAYVVDTGIDGSNVDFEGRVSGGFTAVLDGRGAGDCNGHGTHVAGTIAGRTYGVAKKATLVPVRVLDCAGSGTYSSVISGLDWIAANHPAGTPAVVNMSLGGPASSTLDGAIRNLISKGITVVVAAGNSAADACNYSPARVLEAITVAATTVSDSRASYSNFGSCVDIFAPGSEIVSTWLGSSTTNTISGTSMATPHVAGTLTRFLTQNPTLTPGQAANSLLTSATTGAVLSGGINSPNKLLYIYVTPDTTTAVPVDTSPTFKKTIIRGKKR